MRQEQEEEEDDEEDERRHHWVGGEVQEASARDGGGGVEVDQLWLKDSGDGQRQEGAMVGCWNEDEESPQRQVHLAEERMRSGGEVEETNASQLLGMIEELVRRATANSNLTADPTHVQQDKLQV
jgi:hypothetical protein